MSFPFSFYWKEIAIVLAGLFAVGGVLSDIKDKVTGRITLWGKFFFVLTIISLVGGVYTQWQDSAEEARRNLEAQAATLKVLERTEQSVYDLSRLLQPIDRPKIELSISLDCAIIRIKPFCDSARATSKRQIAHYHIEHVHGIVSVDPVDWSFWPPIDPGRRGEFVADVSIYLFKDKVAPLSSFAAFCYIEKCTVPSDMTLNFTLHSQKNWDGEANMFVTYNLNDENIGFQVGTEPVSPEIHTGKILSLVDLPGSTIVVFDNFNQFGVFKQASMDIYTEHGQKVHIGPMQLVRVNNYTFFTYRFPPKPSTPSR